MLREKKMHNKIFKKTKIDKSLLKLLNTYLKELTRKLFIVFIYIFIFICSICLIAPGTITSFFLLIVSGLVSLKDKLQYTKMHHNGEEIGSN